MTPRITDPASRLRRCRDLTVLELEGDQLLVVACDSDGGIGSKSQDVVKVSEELVGTFAVRVPLFEIIASGSEPFLIADCLSVEMEGTGEKILTAIKRYAAKAGIVGEEQFTGSTEDNVPTVQTGVGVTVLALAEESHFTPGSSEAGDCVYCIGIPKSGPQFQLSMDDPEMAGIEDLISLRGNPFVRDMLPVGSRGILHEAHELASSASLRFVLKRRVALDLERSAGPSSCVLVSASPESAEEIESSASAPVNIIGELL